MADAAAGAIGPAASLAGARQLESDFDALTHAVVNGLNTITAASDLADLLIARNEPAAASKTLARIGSECMRAARLLREGRAYATFPVEPGRGSVDAVGLLRGCADAFDGRVEVVADPWLPALRGDSYALRRAFMEILVNAFQFGAERVRVVLEAKASAQPLHITFHDDGPGTATPGARVFEPFFSTCPAEHSGLGLALAARVVRAHGGAIGLAAAERGSVVRIEMPTGVA